MSSGPFDGHAPIDSLRRRSRSPLSDANGGDGGGDGSARGYGGDGGNEPEKSSALTRLRPGVPLLALLLPPKLRLRRTALGTRALADMRRLADLGEDEYVGSC